LKITTEESDSEEDTVARKAKETKYATFFRHHFPVKERFLMQLFDFAN